MGRPLERRGALIVTIDGPAGSGKSSAARGLADRLGFEALDTGAMYRAVALALQRVGVTDLSTADWPNLLENIRIELPPNRVLLNGDDVTAAIRTADISQGASRVAALPVVRRFLVAQQRAIAQGRRMVCEGRDQGTVVFPDAACKFFLSCDPAERARRRLAQLRQAGDTTATLESVLKLQQERDERDARRDLSPMVPAHDAVLLDTTHLTLDQVLDRMEREVRACFPA